MLAVVGIVSFCVHLFSLGYMGEDRRKPIFFANISLFTFAMLGLVLADSLLFLFVFWELMGLMSYLLIGHFAHDPSQPFFHRWATWASKKAFLTTRIGDVCLFIGLLMFYDHFETLRFSELWEKGREAVAGSSLRSERARRAQKPPTPSGVTVASEPPEMTTSASSLRIALSDSPSAWPAEAQAEATA